MAHPWTQAARRARSPASGVVIEGKRILTNAHVVLYASQVQVQANQAGDKMSATVEAIAPGIDLAVLKLDDEVVLRRAARRCRAPARCRRSRMRCSPTASRPAAPRCRSPRGIVSRIEFVPYNYPELGPAHPDRCRHQSRQQRRPGDRGRQDDRPRLQSPAGMRRTSATSSPTRRSSCSSRTSADGRTTASPGMYDDAADAREPGAARLT